MRRVRQVITISVECDESFWEENGAPETWNWGELVSPNGTEVTTHLVEACTPPARVLE